MPLEEWIRVVCYTDNTNGIMNVAFPTDEHRDQFITTINQRSEEEIHRLLYNFLVKSCSFGLFDELKFSGFVHSKENAPEIFERAKQMQFYKRLTNYMMGNKKIPPWEGNTWILDLLPHFPKLALEGLNAYIMSHIQLLPDWRISGLFDTAEVIRAKYIGFPETAQQALVTLLDISPRDFEHIVERLFDEMKYETFLTPPSKDGGRDVIATKQKTGNRERLYIECKRYAPTHPVDRKTAFALLGNVSNDKVTKGIIITTSRFTRGAKKLAEDNHRIELIDGLQLVPLLNEYIGTRWPVNIEKLIATSKREKFELEKVQI